MRTTLYAGLLVIGLGLMPVPVSAQQENGPRRQFNFEEMRQQQAERMKADLKVTEEEWKAIQPLIENVQAKAREAMTGRFGGFGARAGAPRGDNNNADRTRGGDRRGNPSPEIEALNKALESESTPAADLKAKMADARAARKKSEAALQQAREELRKVLTARQEAVLFVRGILD